MSKKEGRLIVISAPSGCGKGTVIKRLLELNPNICYSVSATTRAPRAGEIDGVSYHFISRDSFLKMIEDNELLEYAEYVNEYYGTPKQFITDCISNGKDVILEIEVLGAKQIMDKVPDAISFFLVPPSMEILERRLRGRGTDSEEKIKERLIKAESELKEKEHYAHIVVSDEVDRTADEILSIIEMRE